ncbi:MAG: Crp/Fnr family transcriptional regulator [Lautropia sp.]
MTKSARRAPVAVTQTTLLAPTQPPVPSSSLLTELGRPAREALGLLGRDRSFGKGDLLFEQGDPHDGIFLIEDGVVRSYYVSEDGRELTLGYWGAGNYVGGPQLFGGGLHAWTSQAESATRCVFLPGSALRRLAEQRPEVAMALLDALVHKSACYSALLQLLATHSMKVRLARLLVILTTNGNEPVIHLTHGQLAGMIGSTRQRVSQALETFEKRTLIRKQPDGSVRVLRSDQLARLD